MTNKQLAALNRIVGREQTRYDETQSEALTGSESVTVADDSFKASLEQYPVGGLIFFAQNLENPDQTRDLLSTIQSDYS